ncbi:MAG TPA: LemA family protein [Thermoanaerobaculia bacterium]|nr:LemA family protein [Thermoanaerobaculia bacterium]
MMLGMLLFLVVVVVVVLFVIGMYNGLVRAKNEVGNAWSQIDVQLNRRHDLIPNLVETVKGYMTHERETLEAVVKARQQAVQITGGATIEEKARIENQLSQTLKTLFAVSENYPQLKANENFLALQEELASTENKISFARQYYNDSAMNMNNKVEMFPTNIFANMFNFKKAAFFEVESAEIRKPVAVKF